VGVKLQYFTVADYIVSFLEHIGSKKVFLLPGGGNMYLVDAVAKNKKIEAIPMHHEQSTGIAAEAYSRISGKLGVALVTTGPGATNVITGVAGAWIESSPMIVISGQVKTKDMIGSKKLRQSGVQEVNIVPMIKNITKYSITLKNEKNLKAVLYKAYHEAISGRPGPVWIDVPLNIQAKKIKKPSFKKKNKNITKKKLNIKFLEKILLSSKKPVILIGHGVRIAKAEKLVEKLSNKFSIPLLFTWNAMDMLPFKSENNFGKPGGVALRYPNFIIQNSDLLISIGSSLDNIITAYNPKEFAKYAKKIMVNIDEQVLKYNKIKCEKKINADCKLFLNEFLNFKVKNKNWLDWLKFCKNLKEQFKLENEKKFNNKGKIRHYELVKALSKYIPENFLIATGSSGLSIEQFYTFFENKKNQRIFLTSGLGAMGFGLPAAIGSYFAKNNRKLCLIEGDGSFQLNLQELAVIAKFRIPIVIIIFNNQGYTSIRNTQKNYFNERYCGTGPEAKLGFPNYEKLSQAYQIDYLKLKKREDLNRLKKVFQNINRPIIVDVILGKNEILSPKVSSVVSDTGKIQSLPLEDMSPLLPLNKLREIMQGKISKMSILARKNA
jgi:acetolactate synthase I/II/III large subunit